MNYWKFLLYTTIGAGAWHAILAAMGWYLHSAIGDVSDEKLNSIIGQYNHYIVIAIVAIVLLAVAFFAVRHHIRKKA